MQPRRRLVGDQLQRKARHGGDVRPRPAAARWDGRGNRRSRSRRSSPRRSRSGRSASAGARHRDRGGTRASTPPSLARSAGRVRRACQNVVEIGRVDAALGQRAAGRLIQVFAAIAATVRPSVNACRKAEPLGQSGENRVVVARVAIRRQPPGASPPSADRRLCRRCRRAPA